jgi:hypothetical protein
MLKPETKALDIRATLLCRKPYDWYLLTSDNEDINIFDILEHFNGKVVRFKISEDEWQ